MAAYVVNHKVRNFVEWKKAYDAFRPKAKDFGIEDHYVLQSAEDQNHVVVVGEGSLADLRKFLGSDSLRSAMQGAGVSGVPDIFIGEDRK